MIPFDALWYLYDKRRTIWLLAFIICQSATHQWVFQGNMKACNRPNSKVTQPLYAWLSEGPYVKHSHTSNSSRNPQTIEFWRECTILQKPEVQLHTSTTFFEFCRNLTQFKLINSINRSKDEEDVKKMRISVTWLQCLRVSMPWSQGISAYVSYMLVHSRLHIYACVVSYFSLA